MRADCAEDEVACPNFEFECKSKEQWTKCLHGTLAGQCVARRHECGSYDRCMDNYTTVGCRKFHLFMLHCMHHIRYNLLLQMLSLIHI